MPKRPYEWRIDAHGCYKHDIAELGLGPRVQTAHLLVFLHLRTTNLPAPTASCAVNKRNKEGLSADTAGRSEGRDDVVDRDVVHQSHVSACLSTSFAITSESLEG